MIRHLGAMRRGLIAHANFMVAARAEVRGFTIDPLGYHIVENVDIAGPDPAR